MQTPEIGVAVLFAVTGCIGFEATAVFRDETRHPAKYIPRATLLAVAIVGGFYSLSSWAMIAAVGPDAVERVAAESLSGESNMLLAVTTDYLGFLAADVVQVLLTTSLFACVLSFHNVIARYQFTLANKGVLPSALGLRHPTFAAPSRSSLVQTATAGAIGLALALVGLDPLIGVFGSMAAVSTVGMILLMLLTSVATTVFFRRRHNPGRRLLVILVTLIAPIVSIVSLVATFGLVLANLTLVTGGDPIVSIGLAGVPVAAIAAGMALGGRWDMTRPPRI